jgi:Formate hydrogenlyase subunit 3/Multisubunit Na+/H+ antiporter, MnhD subunit
MNVFIYLIYLLFFIPIGISFAYFTKYFQGISKIGSIIEVFVAFLLMLAPFRTYSYFDINQVNRVLVISVVIVYLMAVFYASKYHSELSGNTTLGLHYSLMHIFTFTMLFSLLINDFGLMWIGIEATTASSALLLIIERERNQIEAAWRYMLIVSSGLTLAILAIILIYMNYHTLTVTQALAMGHTPSLLLSVAGVTALVGFGTKIGIFPMHTWLPDAHGEAPSEISAMFSGILLPVAAYVLYRFYEATYSVQVTQVYIIFILASLVFVALVMPSQKKYQEDVRLLHNGEHGPYHSGSNHRWNRSHRCSTYYSNARLCKVIGVLFLR